MPPESCPPWATRLRPSPADGFPIDVPDHWTVLDLDPATSEAWLSAFLSNRLSDRPHTQPEGLARRALRSLLDQLREQQVFFAAILAADVGGEPVSASATLAWRRLGPAGSTLPIDGLARVATEAPAEAGEDRSERLVEVVTLPAGPAVRVTSAGVAVPGRCRSTVPDPPTGWSLTTSTANPRWWPASLMPTRWPRASPSADPCRPGLQPPPPPGPSPLGLVADAHQLLFGRHRRGRRGLLGLALDQPAHSTSGLADCGVLTGGAWRALGSDVQARPAWWS